MGPSRAVGRRPRPITRQQAYLDAALAVEAAKVPGHKATATTRLLEAALKLGSLHRRRAAWTSRTVIAL